LFLTRRSSDLGRSTLMFAISIGTKALGLTLSSFAAARLAGRVSPIRLAAIGILAQVIVLVVLSAAAMLSMLPLWALIVGMFLTVSALGLVAGPMTRAALDRVPYAAGSGAALLCSLRFFFGALVTPVGGL